MNEKLARWAGIKNPHLWQGGNEVESPDDFWIGEYDGEKITFLSFTTSLDACFKWLVPHIGYAIVTFDTTATDGNCVVLLEDFYLAQPIRKYEGEAETPALALCKAIENLIDEVK